MAITFPNSTRTARANHLLGLINSGSTTSSGKIVFKTSGGTTLGTVICANPAFNSASNGVATSAATTRDESADATGTVAKAEFQDRDNNVVFSVDVATSSGDGATLTIVTTSVISGQPFECGTITFTEPS